MLLWIAMIMVSLAAGLLCFLLAKAALWQCLLLSLACFAALHAVFLLVMWVSGLFIDKDKPIEKTSPICCAGAKFVCFILCLYAGIDLRLSGLEKLPKKERFLLVCNHRSMFDPITALHALSSYDLAFVSKPSNMRLPIVGRVMYGIGCLGIDRENDRNALKTILQAADYLKRGLCSMAIYPEGTRSRDCRMLPFHPGSFKTAQKAGVPLVIACTSGTEKVRKNFPFRRTVVEFKILETISAEAVKAAATAELAEHSRSLMESALS